MHVSPHFTLEELCRSARADEAGINNTATHPHIIENLTELALNILEPIRTFIGPFSPTSCFRSRALNRLIHGSAASQHSKGQASDQITLDNYALAEFIFRELPFDQLILEHVTEEKPNNGWIHVSYVSFRKPRKEVLYFDGTEYHRLDWNSDD